MNQEKRMILEMISNGDITVDEAERLFEAIPEESQQELTSVPNVSKIKPKRLKIMVTEDQKTKVDVRIPFSLIKAGLKIGKASLALGAKYNTDMDSQQILDLLKEVDIEEILNSIDDGDIVLPYTMIDMDNHEDGKNEHVTIILE